MIGRNAPFFEEAANLVRKGSIPGHITRTDDLPGPACLRVGDSRLKGRQVAVDIG